MSLVGSLYPYEHSSHEARTENSLLQTDKVRHGRVHPYLVHRIICSGVFSKFLFLERTHPDWMMHEKAMLLSGILFVN